MRGKMLTIALTTACAVVGCASLPMLTPVRAVSPNPLTVPTGDFEAVWKECVAVLGEYFEIASENRLSGQILTQPRVGATLIEPWQGDSVGFDERLESTLQSIRRFAKVVVTPAPGGGFLVKVEVRKELEDLVKPDRQAGGRAVFTDQIPINRDRLVVGPMPLPIGWIPKGRDPKLEQAILARLRDRLFL